VEGRLFSDDDGSWDVPGFLPLGKKMLLFVPNATHGPRMSLSTSRASALSPRSLASFSTLPFWDRVVVPLPQHVHKGGSNVGLVSLCPVAGPGIRLAISVISCPRSVLVWAAPTYSCSKDTRALLIFSLVLPMGGQGVRVGV